MAGTGCRCQKGGAGVTAGSTNGSTRVLIAGGGYAGITAAVGLRRFAAGEAARLRLTLVNKHDYHYFTTLLHRPAAGHGSFDEVAVDIRALLGPGAEVIRGHVEEIDPRHRRVRVWVERDDRRIELGYDRLVVALGSDPQYYNIAGLERHALTLRSLNTARLIRAHVEFQLALLKNVPAEPWRSRIVIGGGGYSGVELAGELADWRPQLARRHGLRENEIEIVLVEAAPTLLPGFDEELVARATAILRRKGVRVATATAIREVTQHEVLLSDGECLRAGTVVWTGGVRGNRLVEAAGFRVNRQGRAEVDPYLRAVEFPDVYVAGDSALTLDAGGRPLPPTAQLAVQHGWHVARNLRNELTGRPLEPFVPRMYGTLLSLGRNEALGVVGGVRVSGWVARAIKDLNAYRYVWSIGGPGLALRKWLERWL